MSFTQGGPKKPMPSKGAAKAMPSKAGFSGKDKAGFAGDMMEQAMTGGAGGGPSKGKSFGKKYDTATMSQMIRKRGSPIAHTVD